MTGLGRVPPHAWTSPANSPFRPGAIGGQGRLCGFRPANLSSFRTPHSLLSKLAAMDRLLSKLAAIDRLRLATFVLGIVFWLALAVFGIFIGGTLAHRYPEHFSVFGVLISILVLVQLCRAWVILRVRKQEKGATTVAFGLSEAGLRITRSADGNTLIPWDQILSARYSKALGIIVVHSPLFKGRYLISRWEQEGREHGAFEKAATLMEKSIGSPRWRERWI